MDINRMNEFLVLSKCLNFSKAANQLYLTQPVLSRHINELEEFLGTPLFLRDTHSVKLTPLGKKFAEEIEDVVLKYNEVMTVMDKEINNSLGKISIGYIKDSVKSFFPEFTLYFSEKYPNIHLELHEYNFSDLVYGLNEGELDVVFLTHIDRNSFEGIKSEVVLEDNLNIVVNNNHPLAEKKEVSLKDLSGVPMISFSKKLNPAISKFHSDLFKKSKNEYNLVEEVPNLETALFLVSIDKGAFILPNNNDAPEGLKSIPITDEMCKINLNLIYRKNNKNPSIHIFSKSLLKYLGIK